MYIFKCDTCGDTFKRPKNTIDPDRIKKVHKHFCKKCDL
jgi:hypothetical protein